MSSGGLETTDHLRAIQVFEKRAFDGPGAAMCASDAHQVSVVYRLFGYDTVWYGRETKEQVITWANVASIIVDPAVLYFNPMLEDVFVAIDAERRTGRSRDLPNIANFLEDGASLQIQKPRYKITEHGDRKMISRPYIRINRGRKPVNVMISAPVAYTTAKFVAKPHTTNIVADFRGREHLVTPANPEGRPTATRADAAITDCADMTQTLTSVEGAG